MPTYQDSLLQKKRIQLIFGLLILLGIVVVFRLFNFQVMRFKDFSALADSQHWTRRDLQAKRGKIYVKDFHTGEKYPLALNQSLDLVYAVSQNIKDKDDTAEKLSSILELKKEEILDLLGVSPVYAPLKRKLTPEQSKKIADLKLAGIFLKPEQWRYWPEGELLSQALGFVDDEGRGRYGIEEYFEKEMAGVSGILNIETDALGVQLPIGNNILRPSHDGKDIVLTINRDIQLYVETKLKESVAKHRASGGSAIVMNPQTGEVIAMANMPGFDLNNFGKQENFEVFKNPVVSNEFEPGSIFKIITMAAALDSEKVKPDDTYEDTGNILLGGHTIRNSDGKAHGTATMATVLEQSLNTGTVHLLSKMGENIFQKYIKDFGFNVSTGIEIAGESQGNIPSMKDVGEHQRATMTFGQGLSVTPIQMATATSTIANGGQLIQPKIVNSIIEYGTGKETVIKSKEVRQVISPQTAASLTAMMIGVVEKGHGYQAKVKGYKVAGKTGTAQVPVEGRYDPYKTIGSFTGFLPALDPKFVIYTKIDHPKDVVWAESTAAPLFGAIADFLLKYYQIPPTE